MTGTDYQAPPPDAGGHLGVGTRPEDLRDAPREGPSPPLHTDPARGRGVEGFAFGVVVFFAALAVLSVFYFYY